MTPQLTPDELLTTTRAVRRRLDLDRPVDHALIEQCLTIALQAPSGSTAQNWRWIVVDDVAQKERIAELYRAAFDDYRRASGLFADPAPVSGDAGARVASSIAYLAQNLHRVPVLLVTATRVEGSAVLPDPLGATLWGSLMPAVWSYMLAARARGLGTVWTDLHLRYEWEIAEVLDIPGDVRQGPLIPTAHTLGTRFSPAPRTPLDEVVHRNRW